jgi:hypothetical protein
MLFLSATGDSRAQILNFRRTDTATGAGPQAVASADFNGDGIADIAVLNSSGSSASVLLGNGDGTFKPPLTTALGAYPQSFAVADFSLDGKADLVADDIDNGRIFVMLGRGDGTFQAPIILPICCGLAIGDFNGDGKPDIAVATGVGVEVALGVGDGTFLSPTFNSIPGAADVSRIAISDFNRDGKLDIVTVDQFLNNISILLGKGDGTFQTAVSYPNTSAHNITVCFSVGDLNGDGKPDVVTGDDFGVEVYLGNGDGSFQSAVPYALSPYTKAVAIADVTGDGKLDIVAVTDRGSPSTSLMWVLPGAGDGTFGTAVSFLTGQGPSSVATADFNRDGSLDIATADTLANGVSVLINIAAHPMFFTGEAALGSGIFYLQFPDSNLFGYYTYLSNTIIYHFDMGYESIVDAPPGAAYLYDFTSGHWWYTSTSLFPYLYDFTLNTFIYYFPDPKSPGHYTTSPRYFSNLTTQTIFTM